MVIYVVCYDLSASQEMQVEQRAYWLNFLQSTLPSSPENKSKWRVLVVGTKSEKANLPKNTSDPMPSWQQKWPDIPLHDQHFMVSSYKMKGVKVLTEALEHICATIFEQHTILIPITYKKLLRSIQSIPQDKCIIPVAELKAVHWLGSHEQFDVAVKYLHAVGHIVMLGEGLVCTCPQIIPKITAEFISPEAVRNRLSENYDVQILNEEQVGVVLNIGKATVGYVPAVPIPHKHFQNHLFWSIRAGCVTSLHWCSTSESASSWWAVEKTMPYTCFQAWAASQVVPLSLLLFLVSEYSFFYLVIKLSHPFIPYQIRLDSTSHGQKDSTMLDCEWPHHPIESSHLGSCANSSSQSSPCWMYPCGVSLFIYGRIWKDEDN